TISLPLLFISHWQTCRSAFAAVSKIPLITALSVDCGAEGNHDAPFQIFGFKPVLVMRMSSIIQDSLTALFCAVTRTSKAFTWGIPVICSELYWGPALEDLK